MRPKGELMHAIEKWARNRIGREASQAHNSELKLLTQELRRGSEALVDVAPVRIGRLEKALLAITDRRLFTVSRKIDVLLGSIESLKVDADRDDPKRFTLVVSTLEQQILLRVDRRYQENLLTSLKEVTPSDGSMPRRARAFHENQKKKSAEEDAKRQKQEEDEQRTLVYFALVGNVAAYFFWYFIWPVLAAAAFTAYLWSLKEDGTRRPPVSRGALVAATVVSAINLFVVAVDRGIIG
jgi:hypothetical protein